MIVVVLSVCPEKLRGELTRWLLEVSAGVYVGHVPARVRDLLWLRIIEDVGRGRALMVHSARGEQRLAFKVHNHAWEAVDLDGLTLVRRTTADSRALASAKTKRKEKHEGRTEVRKTVEGDSPDSDSDAQVRDSGPRTRNWSHAARRRRFRNTIEQRRND